LISAQAGRALRFYTSTEAHRWDNRHAPTDTTSFSRDGVLQTLLPRQVWTTILQMCHTWLGMTGGHHQAQPLVEMESH
jgi:hypothetical protein